MKRRTVDTNQLLRDMYHRAWPSLSKGLTRWSGLSNPHFLEIPDSYRASKQQLMVVGQQTHDWPEGGGFGQRLGADPVAFLMRLYAKFNVGENYKKTPFWIANYEVQRLLNPDSSSLGFVWSNLVKVDQVTKRPDRECEEFVCSFSLLAKEIAICQPDVMLFFTGAGYDERLASTFPGIVREPLPHWDNLVVALRHPDLPAKSYRTYHPGWYWRSGLKALLTEVINAIVADAHEA